MPKCHSLTNIFLNPNPSNLATTPLNKVAESSDISVLDPKLNFDDFESLCLTFSILVYLHTLHFSSASNVLLCKIRSQGDISS